MSNPDSRGRAAHPLQRATHLVRHLEGTSSVPMPRSHMWLVAGRGFVSMVVDLAQHAITSGFPPYVNCHVSGGLNGGRWRAIISPKARPKLGILFWREVAMASRQAVNPPQSYPSYLAFAAVIEQVRGDRAAGRSPEVLDADYLTIAYPGRQPRKASTGLKALGCIRADGKLTERFDRLVGATPDEFSTRLRAFVRDVAEDELYALLTDGETSREQFEATIRRLSHVSAETARHNAAFLIEAAIQADILVAPSLRRDLRLRAERQNHALAGPGEIHQAKSSIRIATDGERRRQDLVLPFGDVLNADDRGPRDLAATIVGALLPLVPRSGPWARSSSQRWVEGLAGALTSIFALYLPAADVTTRGGGSNGIAETLECYESAPPVNGSAPRS